MSEMWIRINQLDISSKLKFHKQKNNMRKWNLDVIWFSWELKFFYSVSSSTFFVNFTISQIIFKVASF